jgi:ubiquinone/menaquinone biosynthesis C-methylase UbiE
VRRRTRAALAGLAIVLVVGATLVAGPLTRACGGAQWRTLDPEKAMDAIGLAPGMIIGEAGAGGGYFTFPMIRRIGAGGAIYANDIDERALAQLRSRAEREGHTNIHTVVGRTDDPLFPRKDLEMVVVVHALHDFDKPVEWMVNLKKYLRPGGTLAVIDIDPERNHDRHFWPRARILEYASQAGYDLVKIVDDPVEHMFVILKPRPS